MREHSFFTYNGISSEEMGVRLVMTSSGLYKESFLPSRKLNEVSIKGNRKIYLQGVESEPLSFSLQIFIEEWQDKDNLRQIKRWFYQDNFKPFYFNENPDRICYAVIEGESSLNHNGAKDGYFEITLKCNSSYFYSNPITHKISHSPSPQLMLLDNEGDVKTYPYLTIKKTIEDGDIFIKNKTTGEEFVLEGIQEDEMLYIDCENEEIVSSLEYVNVYRYDNHNDTWLSLITGENELELGGNFEVKIEYENVYFAE